MALYRTTSLGSRLEEVCQTMVENQEFGEEMMERVMAQFDQSVQDHLSNKKFVNNSATVSGHLHTYRYCDSVWTFYLQNAEFKPDKMSQETVTADVLKIVAMDAKQ